MKLPCLFCEIKVVMIYIPNLIMYGSVISNDVFYVIRCSTLSRGRKHCNTFHGALTAM